jgi:hypothetical protein
VSHKCNHIRLYLNSNSRHRASNKHAVLVTLLHRARTIYD